MWQYLGFWYGERLLLGFVNLIGDLWDLGDRWGFHLFMLKSILGWDNQSSQNRSHHEMFGISDPIQWDLSSRLSNLFTSDWRASSEPWVKCIGPMNLFLLSGIKLGNVTWRGVLLHMSVLSQERTHFLPFLTMGVCLKMGGRTTFSWGKWWYHMIPPNKNRVS